MERIRELCADITPRELLLFGGYAFYLAFGYMVFESATMLASGGLSDASFIAPFLAAVICVRVIVYGSALLLTPLRNPRSTFCVAIACVACALGFIVLGMLLQFAGVLPSEGVIPWLVFAGGALGAGGVVAGMLWVRVAATLSSRGVYLFVVVSNLTSLAVYFLAMLMPAVLHVPLCAVLFVASIWCSWRCLALREDPRDACTKKEIAEAWHMLWRPVVSTSALAFMSGFMLQVALWHPIPLDVFQSTSLITQCVVMLALLAPVLFVKKAPALESVYKTALPLSAAGFLLLPVIWNGVGGLANACAQLGTLVAGIILWCIIADTSRVRDLPVTALFLPCMICTSLAQAAGALFGLLRAESLQPGDVSLTALALAALYVVFLVSTFLFKDRSFKTGERVSALYDAASDASEAASVDTLSAEALLAQQEAVFEARCEAVSDQAGFTPREREVFVLVARGKTNAVIAKELVVSENTVKFHIKSIYQKLGIHSKVEVAALLDDAPTQQ